MTWSVDGRTGGTSRHGRITVGGLYRAPSSPPPGSHAVIGARSATGATGKVTIRIRKAPRKRAAPTVRAPRVPKQGLSQIRLGRHNRSLIAVVSSAQVGRVRFTATRGGKQFGRCALIVRKGGSATCRMRIPTTVSKRTLLCKIPRTTKLNLPDVVVTATLTRLGKLISTRRARAR